MSDGPKCRCGDPIKQVDLYVGPFGQKLGPRFGWVHVDKDRNLSHQARLAPSKSSPTEATR